jgi:hypothetical protein
MTHPFIKANPPLRVTSVLTMISIFMMKMVILGYNVSKDSFGLVLLLAQANMCRFLTQNVSSCTAYQEAKVSNRRPAEDAEPVPILAEPGTEWTIEFLELPTSANGFSCVLVRSGPSWSF